MSLIPETIGHGSLIDKALFPNLYTSPQPVAAPTSPQPGPAAVPAPTPKPGLRDILMRIFGGENDPRLTDEQNHQAGAMGVIQAGLGTIAAAQQPGASGLGSIAQGAQSGAQAGQQQREMTYGRTQAQRVQNALNDPNVVGQLTPQQRAAIAMMDPKDAVEAIGKLAFAPPTVVGENSVVYDPATRSIVARNGVAKPVDLPPEMDAALFKLGINPSDPNLTSKQRDLVAQLYEQYTQNKKPVTNIVNVPQMEKKELTQFDLDTLKDVRNGARSAQDTLSNLDLMSQLLQQNPDLTGGTSEALMQLKSLASNSGVVDADKLSAQQLFQKLGNQVMFAKVKELGGRILQSEITLMRKTVANLGNTPEANKLILEVMRRQEQAKIDNAALADKWVADHGTIVGFESYLRDYAKEHPIFAGLLDKAPF